jgi:hypothetical protein
VKENKFRTTFGIRCSRRRVLSIPTHYIYGCDPRNSGVVSVQQQCWLPLLDVTTRSFSCIPCTVPEKDVPFLFFFKLTRKLHASNQVCLKINLHGNRLTNGVLFMEGSSRYCTSDLKKETEVLMKISGLQKSLRDEGCDRLTVSDPMAVSVNPLKTKRICFI